MKQIYQRRPRLSVFGKYGAAAAVAMVLGLSAVGVVGGAAASAQSSNTNSYPAVICQHWRDLGFKNKGDCVSNLQKHHGHGYGGDNGNGDDNHGHHGHGFGHFFEEVTIKLRNATIIIRRWFF